MTSENFLEMFQLIKDDITKQNTEMRELCESYAYEYYSFN